MSEANGTRDLSSLIAELEPITVEMGATIMGYHEIPDEPKVYQLNGEPITYQTISAVELSRRTDLPEEFYERVSRLSMQGIRPTYWIECVAPSFKALVGVIRIHPNEGLWLGLSNVPTKSSSKRQRIVAGIINSTFSFLERHADSLERRLNEQQQRDLARQRSRRT